MTDQSGGSSGGIPPVQNAGPEPQIRQLQVQTLRQCSREESCWCSGSGYAAGFSELCIQMIKIACVYFTPPREPDLSRVEESETTASRPALNRLLESISHKKKCA